jgi:hypothetical protein
MIDKTLPVANMTFAELRLYQAVYRVFGKLDNPGSED